MSLHNTLAHIAEENVFTGISMSRAIFKKAIASYLCYLFIEQGTKEVLWITR